MNDNCEGGPLVNDNNESTMNHNGVGGPTVNDNEGEAAVNDNSKR